ncbi:MAG TPA: hypothetical protein VJ741_18450 [Solirubrobacteraceae bacterium]|nr:hypothetical protein [Solirubrobacteraceae bacterium]
MTLLPEYRAQLYGAAERRARRGAVGLPRLWPVAISTAVAAAVVVVAVAALSHRHPVSAPTHSGPAVSTSQFTGMLGVMRRPQTQADRRTWVPGFFHTFASKACRAASTPFQCTLRLDRPLIREVAVPRSGYRVGLLPYTSEGKIAGVAVTLRGPGINYRAAGPWIDSTTIPPGLSALRSKGLMLSAYIAQGINRGVIVVPDGVARVVLGPVRLTERSVTRRIAPTAGASAEVHDNVALFQLNGLTMENLKLRAASLHQFFSQGSGGECRLTLAIYRLVAETHMLWLAPDGKVVNHALIRFPVYVGTRHPPPGTVPFPSRCGATG